MIKTMPIERFIKFKIKFFPHCIRSLISDLIGEYFWALVIQALFFFQNKTTGLSYNLDSFIIVTYFRHPSCLLAGSFSPFLAPPLHILTDKKCQVIFFLYGHINSLQSCPSANALLHHFEEGWQNIFQLAWKAQMQNKAKSSKQNLDLPSSIPFSTLTDTLTSQGCSRLFKSPGFECEWGHWDIIVISLGFVGFNMQISGVFLWISNL